MACTCKSQSFDTISPSSIEFLNEILEITRSMLIYSQGAAYCIQIDKLTVMDYYY